MNEVPSGTKMIVNETKKEVILVESIGDAMALYEQGIKNVLVMFGLSVNSHIINYLNSKSIDRLHTIIR